MVHETFNMRLHVAHEPTPVKIAGPTGETVIMPCCGLRVPMEGWRLIHVGEEDDELAGVGGCFDCGDQFMIEDMDIIVVGIGGFVNHTGHVKVSKPGED